MSNKYQTFQSNEEFALALFEHLKATGKISGSFVESENILHDVNNFRVNEWLELVDRNISTKAFFDYMPSADFFEDEFAYGRAVSPDVLLKVAFDKEYPENVTFDDVRNALDENGFENLWDYCVEDLDEAINNLSDDMMLLGVGFYEKDGYFARVFEITEEMAARLDSMLVVTERDVYVLPCDVHPGDKVVGPYVPSLDSKIADAESVKQNGVVQDNVFKNEIERE